MAYTGLCVLLGGDKLKLPGGDTQLSLGISKEWGPAGNTSSLCCCLVPGTEGAQALSQKGISSRALEQALTKGWRPRAGQGCPGWIQDWVPVDQLRVGGSDLLWREDSSERSGERSQVSERGSVRARRQGAPSSRRRGGQTGSQEEPGFCLQSKPKALLRCKRRPPNTSLVPPRQQNRDP